MAIRRDPSRGLQIGFLALLALSVVTVGWWIADHVPYFDAVENRLAALYAADADAVNALAGEGSIADVAPLLPHLTVDPQTGRAEVDPDALAEIRIDAARRTNRFLWEAGFFLVVLLGGMAVLTRTLSHDRELRRRQQNFLAAVSHEFKSPLASMRLAAETLLRRSPDPDVRRLGQRIVEDGDRLLRMVDNLLDTARLEEGHHTLAPRQTQLNAVAAGAVGDLADHARLNGIEISSDIPDSLTLSADPDALETILRNLLDNAVKACIAGDGHHVTLCARRDGDTIELAVTDDGIGFAPEDAAMIFEKFQRLGDELRRTMPGTGLGLYIVRRLAELSGARVHAASPGPGHGATVTIRWPAR